MSRSMTEAFNLDPSKEKLHSELNSLLGNGGNSVLAVINKKKMHKELNTASDSGDKAVKPSVKSSSFFLYFF